MKRSIYKDLLRWKRNKLRKPLIIDGQDKLEKLGLLKNLVKMSIKM